MEDKLREHSSRILILEEISNKHTVSLAEIKKDTGYIKQKLEDGLSHDLRTIIETITEISPTVKDNKYWVGKIKDTFFWISTIAVGGGLVAFCFHLVRNI